MIRENPASRGTEASRHDTVRERCGVYAGVYRKSVRVKVKVLLKNRNQKSQWSVVLNKEDNGGACAPRCPRYTHARCAKHQRSGLPGGRRRRPWPVPGAYKSSSSSGSGTFCADASSASYCATVFWSMTTSGGLRAGDSTKTRLGSLRGAERGEDAAVAAGGRHGACGSRRHGAGGRAPDELAREPEEGLLEVVVGLGGDVVVLQVLLPVEGDLLGLDLALLHVHLVAHQHDRDVLAHTHLQHQSRRSRSPAAAAAPVPTPAAAPRPSPLHTQRERARGCV